MEIIIKCSDDCRGGKNVFGNPIEEIVRCRDCLYYCTPDPLELATGYCGSLEIGMEPDGYCSAGWRKERR